MNQKYQISGMTCNGCRTHVSDKLNQIPGIKAIVTLDHAEVIIDSEQAIDIEQLNDTLSEIGDYKIRKTVIENNESNSTEHRREYQTITKAAVSPSGKYICPMYCEGHDHTYDAPGSCPVCGMFLVPVKSLADQAAGHSHTQASCCSTHEKVDKPKVTAQSAGKYYCPMMCEGDKLYDKPGSCPVCGMNLEKIPEKKAAVTYSCPMHPEVESDKPGSCPICGMDLVANAAAEEVDHTYQDLRKKTLDCHLIYGTLIYTVHG